MPDGFLLRFTPEWTNLGGIIVRGSSFRGGRAAISIG
jgi:hypothetical protein